MNSDAGCDVKNQFKIFLGSVKTSEHCQASKQYMSLKYLQHSILGLGLTRGHLFSLAIPRLPSDLTNKLLTSAEQFQSSVHPNIPTINHLWLL